VIIENSGIRSLEDASIHEGRAPKPATKENVYVVVKTKIVKSIAVSIAAQRCIELHLPFSFPQAVRIVTGYYLATSLEDAHLLLSAREPRCSNRTSVTGSDHYNLVVRP
jgi:hypothetical protein